jgi:hypothetical protein
MKAFVISMIAMVAIAAVAGFALSRLGWDAAHVYSTDSVRL